MDMSAMIVVIVLTALFFGSIVWLNIYSRRTNAERVQSEAAETGLKNK